MKQTINIIAYYLRNSPVQFGRYRLLKLARPLVRKFGHTLGKQSISTRRGFVMELDLSDWIPQDIYLQGDFEPTTSEIVQKLLRPGDTVVDVGANIGYFSLMFARCVGPTGRVLSFEPVPKLAASLKRNLEINQFSHVSISSHALSDHRATARFFAGPNENSGLSSLREPRDCSESFDVDLAPFDDLVPDCENVSLIKIDVEGAELQVLRGMTKLLQNQRPDILIEITDSFLRELGDSAEALQQFVAQFGYACYEIRDGRISLRTESYSAPPKQWNALLTVNPQFGDGAIVV